MNNDDKYSKLLIEQFSNLSKNQKKVAEYLIEHPQEMAFSSITDIAKKINVSQATIVRLAKALGYKGYLEMKSKMLKHIQKNLTPIEQFQTEFKQSDTQKDILVNLAQQEIDNIKNTANIINKVSFNKTVEIISASHHTYTMGLGLSAFISQITAYLLNRVTLKSTSLAHGSVSFIEQIISMKKNDVIITFSFLPYSSGTIEAAKYARKKGLKIILITDKMTSPIAEYSSIVLQIKSENKIFANSLGAVNVLVYSLAAEVAYKNKKKTQKALSQLNQARVDNMLVMDKEYILSFKNLIDRDLL